MSRSNLFSPLSSLQVVVSFFCLDVGQNAVVCVACVSVCVSFGGLCEFDWVFGLDRWDIEGVVWIVGV